MRDQYVRSLPPATPAHELRHLADASFDALASLSFFEAIGSAPRETGNVLAEPDRCDRWVCSLMFNHANLSKGVAVRYLELGADDAKTDRDYQRFTKTRAQVGKRIVQARTHARRVREQFAEDLRRSRTPAADSATAALVSAHVEEYRELLERHNRRHGDRDLFDTPPGADRDPQWAIRTGLLPRPAGSAARELSFLNDEAFTKVVIDDITTPGGNQPALREPGLLPRWGEALREARGDIVNRTGVTQAYEGDLTLETWLDQPGDVGEARRRLNQLRFMESVLERLYEYDALMERTAAQIGHNLELRRGEVERGAQEDLRNRYGTEHALYEALL